ENRVGDLIGDLVGVTFGHRFRGEQMPSVTAHAALLVVTCGSRTMTFVSTEQTAAVGPAPHAPAGAYSPARSARRDWETVIRESPARSRSPETVKFSRFKAA